MLTASFFPFSSAGIANVFADIERIGKHTDGSGDDDSVRTLEPGVDHRGASGGADLNVTADQGASNRLAAGELDHLEVLDSVFFEETSFLGSPKRRLSRAENRSRAQRLLGVKPARKKEEQKC